MTPQCDPTQFLATDTNVFVAPYDSLVQTPPAGGPRHLGGPIWHDWETAVGKRHCINRKPIDEKPDLPSSAGDIDIIRDAYWCGPVTRHFGHQVAEFGTRIAVYLGSYQHNKKLLFGLRRNLRMDRPTGVIKDILSWYNIPETHVLLTSEPIKVQRLHWCHQQEQLADIPPDRGYVSILSRHANQKLSRIPDQRLNLYVSRASLKTGIIAGESYLEEFFRGLGFKIIYPEALPLAEQLQLYFSASNIVFSEGSAIHALQLLGRISARVFIIPRRPGRKLVRRILLSRASHVAYLESIDFFLPGLTMRGEIPDKGITLLNPRRLCTQLEEHGFSCQSFNTSLFQQSGIDTLKQWAKKIAIKGIPEYNDKIREVNMMISDYLM